ncbi:hypothetical protein [Tellurirhabdus rosea]|uniref:hypothetical protein n=1 Tax=Tellurirhabdus rosea TaxID=2674997 RepID=UPI002258BF26|nr:hypothetical protein [Tellurirhabdus rosea]
MKSKQHKNVPQGFRHLLSRTEVRRLEEAMGLRFREVQFGHLVYTGHLDPNGPIQSSFRTASVSGWETDAGWVFNLHCAGFRDELLPSRWEKRVKGEIMGAITRYVHKITTARETDFIRRPQLWLDVVIHEKGYEVRPTELK